MSASTGLFLNGQRDPGDAEDIRTANVTAAVAIANIVKSSLGPTGLDKMIVDDIGDCLVTNDGATILAQLEVEHPAARLLVELSQLQDKEVGDGTTSVVLVASELLKLGSQLIKVEKIHPTTLMSGYRRACKAAVAYLKSEMLIPIIDKEASGDGPQYNDQLLLNAAQTSMSSKIIGAHTADASEGKSDDNNTSNFFAQLVVDAVKSVKMVDPNSSTSTKKYKYPLSAINIVKVPGQSSTDSELLVNGFVLQGVCRASQGMPVAVGGGSDGGGATATTTKICFLDMNLQKHRMGMGVTIQVTDPAEIDKIKRHEMDLTKRKIDKIIKAGVKVVLTTKGIDDVCIKYFVEAGIIACRRVSRADMNRLAKATGGKIIVTMANWKEEDVMNENTDVDTPAADDDDECIDLDSLGTCRSVREVRLGQHEEMLQFHGCHGTTSANATSSDATAVDASTTSTATTIVLRGPNDYMLDEMDRSVHDALSVVKRLLESHTLVVGGGCCEVALSVYLENYALTYGASTDTDTGSGSGSNNHNQHREQLAIQAFAQALLVVPKTLAQNAAKDSTEVVAQLRSLHAQYQQQQAANDASAASNNNDQFQHYGLDLSFADTTSNSNSNPDIRNNVEAGVVEPAISKIKSLRFATEAAITILRIDDRITVTE